MIINYDTTHTKVDCTKEVRNELKIYAVTHNQKLSDLVDQILREWLLCQKN